LRYFIPSYLPGHELTDHSREVPTRRYFNVIVLSGLFIDDMNLIRRWAVSTGK